ncbi:MAG: hypothetical protein SFW36_22840 [Leptolyngbyaceae cyanobacterium bins.59]|nr:hypothetical protein [Leptolyngbyaceae cyanobacterium bins.59]
MNNYLIVRHGLNSANQPECSRKPIGITRATDLDDAVRAALDCGVSCYTSQTLEAIPLEQAESRDLREVMGIWLIPSRSVHPSTKSTSSH